VIATPPDSSVIASAALALVTLAVVVVAWLRWTRIRTALDTLADTAARVAIGERGLRASARAGVLEPLADALNRLGTLTESAERTLVDRNRQLAIVRGHARLAYWETDRDGRFQRIEYESSWPGAERCASVGALHLERARPLDRSAWQAALEALNAHQPYRGLVLERTSADARSIRVVETGEPAFDAHGSFLGYRGTMRRVDADSSMRDCALRTAAETSPQPIFVVACAPWPLPIVWMNAAGRMLLGEDANRHAPPTLAALLDATDGEDVRELQQATLHRNPLRRTVRVRDRYGARNQVIARLEPLDDGSEGFVLVLDANEAQIEQLRTTAETAQTLGARARELERRAHQLDVVAWSLSHDLRASLRDVVRFTRAVVEDHDAKADAAVCTRLQSAIAAGERMARMIDGLTALAHSTTQPMQRVAVDLGLLAQHIARDLVRAEPEREVQLHCEPSLVVEGDPDLLRLLLQNLFENAWKYTAGRPVASIRFDAVVDARGRATYRVSDNGIGFDPSKADRLFSPFRRLHPEEDIDGIGIGLAIAQQIVQRHGGTIRAESKPGEGSRFVFTLGG